MNLLPSDTTKTETQSTQTGNKYKIVLILLLVIGLAVVIGLSFTTSKDTKPNQLTRVTAPGSLTEISITDQGFMPAVVRVKPGTLLTWTNKTNQPHQIASDPHPTHAGLPNFNNDVVLEQGESLSFQFEKIGNYTFHNHLNPYGFSFKVEVAK
ncbi:MAG: cupredoxin domain-containing protein [Patescibacteria group bacterium]